MQKTLSPFFSWSLGNMVEVRRRLDNAPNGWVLVWTARIWAPRRIAKSVCDWQGIGNGGETLNVSDNLWPETWSGSNWWTRMGRPIYRVSTLTRAHTFRLGTFIRAWPKSSVDGLVLLFKCWVELLDWLAHLCCVPTTPSVIFIDYCRSGSVLHVFPSNISIILRQKPSRWHSQPLSALKINNPAQNSL